MPKPLRISPIALDPTNCKVLKVAVGLINDDGIASLLLPDNSPHGHLLVIDADTELGQQALEESRDGQVKLVLSEKRRQGTNVIWQEPPVRVTDMQELLTRICLRMKATFATEEAMNEPADTTEAASAGSPEDTRAKISHAESTEAAAPPTKPAEAEDAPKPAAPSKSLFHILLNARQQKVCYQIRFNDTWLLVGGHNGTVASNSEPDAKTILSAPFKKLYIEQTDIVAFAKNAQEMNISTLDSLLWQAGVEHSGGHLLDGHDMAQPVRLKAWPNFTRNGFRQSHFKLAAIMARQPISLKELRKEAGVARDEVISFYNAAYAVGLIDRSVGAADVDQLNSKPRTRRKGLLGMLARKLGFR